MMPEVSIIVVNYHTFNLTCNCIQSVIAKTKDVSYEIILVDNGSTPEESAKYQSLFPDIVYINTGANLGFSKGNNAGIERSSGEFILLLNSDTLLLNDAVSLGVNALKKDPSIGVLSGQLQYADGRLQAITGTFPLLSRVLKDLFRISARYSREQRAKYFLGTEWDYTKPVECDWVWGAFFLFRKKDLEQFPDKRLHDDFFMYFEDVQWCYHFKRKLGRKVVFDPAPQAIHYIGQSGDGTKDEVRYLKVILPNEHAWMKKTRGVLYTSLYFFLKGIYYYSLRRPEDVEKGNQFIKYTFK